MYNLKCIRDYLGMTEEGDMNNILTAGAEARYKREVADDNAFTLIKGKFGYYLYSTQRQLFVPATCETQDHLAQGVSTPDGSFSIVPSDEMENTFIIANVENGKWLQLGGDRQYVVHGEWKTKDDGNQWKIIEIGDVDEITYRTAQNAVMQYEDEITSLSSAAQTQKTAPQAFDLKGRRVSDTERGIYIIDGQKRITK